ERGAPRVSRRVVVGAAPPDGGDRPCPRRRHRASGHRGDHGVATPTTRARSCPARPRQPGGGSALGREPAAPTRRPRAAQAFARRTGAAGALLESLRCACGRHGWPVSRLLRRTLYGIALGVVLYVGAMIYFDMGPVARTLDGYPW